MPRSSSEVSQVLSRGFTSILGRSPTPGELQSFERYLALLVQWNRAHRLTGYRGPIEIAEKLFLDSLLFLRWIEPGAPSVLDLGAGAGIPGLPMKIVRPQVHLTLVEARRRRVSFLAAALRELGLGDVSLLAGRAEALLDSQPGLRGAFDAVVTRATGSLRTVLPLALGFVRAGGRVISSGPPVDKPAPSLPADVPYRWETVAGVSEKGLRRFLLVEKP